MIDRDALTGAVSRSTFTACLEEMVDSAQSQGSSFVLLYIDIDNMHRFNDHNGHSLGDEMLKHFVVLIEPLLPNSDSLFRIGGDEFAIILPNYSCKEALHLSEKICDISREQLAPPQLPNYGEYCTGPVKISVSIGITLFEQNMSFECLIRSVEEKVNNAKIAGRNRAWI
jgi:diguanylate cyclase (GGDEF)-like protein